MLLAVEGGSFFSSSASGYSKGLTLLLLGHKAEDKPMRVSPWNHYHLVDQDSDPDLQLASTKPRGCASFVCFGRTSSAAPDAHSPLKVGPTHHQDLLPGSTVLPDEIVNDDDDHDDDDSAGGLDDIGNERKESLKSSLKKKPLKNNKPGSVNESVIMVGEEGRVALDHTERRKVQWTDACGSELAEIKEFEPSELDFSDNDYENGTERSCSCAIM